MPYKRVKNKVYTKASGKWKLKQTCRTAASAEAAIRLLRGLESGSIKRSEVGKGKYAKKKRKKKRK